MPKVTIDGREITVEPGTTVIQAAERLGVFIPRYCWHPAMKIAGNCRICQVEVVHPKGRMACTIACNLPVTEGMVISTNSEAAKKSRADVMEFLLINHPLDCPICDQAGECILQEYSFTHGHDKSRFDEEKVHKSKRIRFSDKITFDAERCIICTRCVRFMKEIAGDEQLAVVERGDHQEIAVAHGKSLDNPYSMNIVDLCPVGALTSTDFRFKTRVWFLTNTPSACASCARNCSITVGARWDKIQRLTPRENQDINKWWMCDYGRLNYHYVHAEDRLGQASLEEGGGRKVTHVDDAVGRAHALVSRFVMEEGGDKVFALVSARLTNEELLLAKRYVSLAIGTGHVDVKPRTGEGDDFLLCADRNPNSAGARLLGVAPGKGGLGLAGFVEGVKAGKIKAAILFGEDLDDVPGALDVLGDLSFLIVLDSRLTETGRRADVLLPGATPFEKDGTIVNVDGFVSRLNRSVRPPADARPDLSILADLLRLAGPDEKVPRTAEETFAVLAAEV
ncbi:MAG: molybdopterin-dependent oxidoreductase, partial [Planctomycetes bacterium]|nr:molybdopterin-dependent oxidoreductase [Planctomycetota bacterium]